jgi:hypothetical protein
MTSPTSVNTALRLCSLTDWSIRHISDIFESATDDESLASVEATFIRNVAATINGTPMSRSVLAQRVLALRQSSKSGLRVVWRRTTEVPLDPDTNRVCPELSLPST